MVQTEFKFFTLKIAPEFHQKIKEFCVKEKISMRDFAMESFNNLFALKEKDTEKG